jgi:hypothetical protein
MSDCTNESENARQPVESCTRVTYHCLECGYGIDEDRRCTNDKCRNAQPQTAAGEERLFLRAAFTVRKRSEKSQ